MNSLLALTYTTQSSMDYSKGTSSLSGTSFLAIMLPILVISLISIIGMWKVFQKAGKPGWAAIVPVYNVWVLFELTGYPAWIALLTFIPFVNIVPAILSLIASFKIAKLFGKSSFFGVMNVFFPFITYPILGFGKAQFQGAPAQAAASPTSPTSTESSSSMPVSSGDSMAPPATPSQDVNPAPQSTSTAESTVPGTSTENTTAEVAPSTEPSAEQPQDQNTPPSNPVA